MKTYVKIIIAASIAAILTFGVSSHALAVVVHRGATVVRPAYHPPHYAPTTRVYPHTRGPVVVHNTVVVHNFVGFRPYYWHPYVPYAWGPYWHPVGWFTAALATTAIIVTIENASKDSPTYYYDNGVFYAPSNGGYVAIAAPEGAIVKALPQGYTTTAVKSTTYYYYGGTFYTMKGDGSYKVVKAPEGAVVKNLPQGAQEVDVNDSKLMEYQGTYYQPITHDGEDAYEVVKINQ